MPEVAVYPDQNFCHVFLLQFHNLACGFGV